MLHDGNSSTTTTTMTRSIRELEAESVNFTWPPTGSAEWDSEREQKWEQLRENSSSLSSLVVAPSFARRLNFNFDSVTIE